jgi:hypothetical protein
MSRGRRIWWIAICGLTAVAGCGIGPYGSPAPSAGEAPAADAGNGSVSVTGSNVSISVSSANGKTTVVYNGKTFQFDGDGCSVVSKNGRLFVNGVEVATGLAGPVELHVTGTLASLSADGSVSCGDVTGDVTANGSVTTGVVRGNVKAGGSVSVNGNVGGNLTASGSVSTGR